VVLVLVVFFIVFVYERKYIYKYECLRVGGEIPPTSIGVDGADEAGHKKERGVGQGFHTANRS
jgi:hypothetical protein